MKLQEVEKEGKMPQHRTRGGGAAKVKEPSGIVLECGREKMEWRE